MQIRVSLRVSSVIVSKSAVIIKIKIWRIAQCKKIFVSRFERKIPQKQIILVDR